MKQCWHRNVEYLIWSVVFLLLMAIVCGAGIAAGQDWLRLTGEKGFFFNYSSDAASDSLFLGESGFSFTQSLILDLEGEFGRNYRIQGHLIDLPNAPGQLFLEIAGPDRGIRFGDGTLGNYNTPLTRWDGDFNGLEGFYRTEHTVWKTILANPVGLTRNESLVIKAGRNYTYTTCQPVREGTLRVHHTGAVLTEGIDFLFNYLTGKLELLFYPETDYQLDLEYQYPVSEVLGNQFLAFTERSSFKKFSFGFSYFGSQSQMDEEPVLIGEIRQPDFFRLGGFNLGWEGTHWRWAMDYWASREEPGRLSWNYMDNMEGGQTTIELFSGSINPLNWFTGGSGSGFVGLRAISPLSDPIHTRDNLPTLAVDYQLQRTGDTAFLYHDFGSDRDFQMLNEFQVWVFGSGENLRLEIQFITNENNYYYSQVVIASVGWQELRIPVDPLSLQINGIPDLSKIRYIKVVIASPSGDAANGTLYFAPVYVVNRSSPEQRWAERAVSPGSSLAVSAVAAIVPGEPADNQVLQLDYQLVPATGWAAAGYQPPVVMDISNYRNLRVYINASETATVTINAIRAGQTYQLGQVVIAATGVWQEYTLPLTNIPRRVLERIEELVIRVSNSGGGPQILQIDILRAMERLKADSDALKTRGVYQNGPWRTQIDYTLFNPGFHDIGASYNYPYQNLRSVSEFAGARWRFRSDLLFYQQPELANGYPLDGMRFEMGFGRDGLDFSFFRRMEEIDSDQETLVSGDRTETGLLITQRWKLWNLEFKHRIFNDAITLLNEGSTDTLTIRYKQGDWWGMSQYWLEDAHSALLDGSSHGLNLGFGFDPPGLDRFQLSGGLVDGTDDEGAFSRYFYQADLIRSWNNRFIASGTLKDLAAPEGDRENLTADRLLGINLRYLPVPSWSMVVDRKWRDWSELVAGDYRQMTQDYQIYHTTNSGGKYLFYMRNEELASGAGQTRGNRYGFTSEGFWVKSWLTQMTLERNNNSGSTLLSDTELINYKYNFKNTRHSQKGLFYWGGWIEGYDTGEDWERQMLQLGWERRFANDHWSWGLKSDLGREISDATIPAWGIGSYILLNDKSDYFQFSLRRQNYSNYYWIGSIDLRLFKGDFYAVNLHGDYHFDRLIGDDLVMRTDLIFYLR